VAGPEIQALVETMRANPPLSGSLEDMREMMASAVGAAPLPEGVAFEEVSAGGVRAEWARAEGAANDRAIVYAHGGGYVLGSIESHRGLAGDLSRATGASVLSLDYRLAPENPFPAAIDDACAAYRHVIEQGMQPSRVAIGGDSAGGGIAAATLIALRDAGNPLPACAICISPWFDLTQSGDTMKTKADEDPMVSAEMLAMMAEAYLAGADPKAPTASPLFGELDDLPPLLIHVGTAEVLLDDSRRFAERARSAGVDVCLEEWEAMIHVWHTFSAMLPEGKQAIERIGEFVRDQLD
jgi:acetyl esterase/lipase